MRVSPIIPKVTYRGSSVPRDKCKENGEAYMYGERIAFTKDGYVVGDDTAEKIKVVRVSGPPTFPKMQTMEDIIKQYNVDLKNPRIREIITGDRRDNKEKRLDWKF